MAEPAVAPPSRTPVARARDVLTLIVVAAGCAAAWLAFRGYVFEDAYITYRHAANLAAGSGFAFNPGEPVLGTTTPLWTLVLALAARVGLDVPATGALLAVLFTGATALAGAVILRRLGHPNAGALYACAVAGGVFALHALSGMETALACFLVHAAVLATLARREWTLGLVLGLACLTRYDGVVLAGVALPLLWMAQRRAPWRAALVAALVVAPWLLYAQVTFGSVLPNTYHAKSTGGPSASAYLAHSLALLAQRLAVPTLAGELPLSLAPYLALVALFTAPALAVLGVARRRPAAALLVLHPLALWAGYAVIGPDPLHWWHVVPAATLFLCAALAGWGELLARAFPGDRAAPTALVLALALVLVPRANLRQGERARSLPEYQDRAVAYAELAAWFRRHGLGDALVLVNEPGYFAWLSGCRVVDGAGLVTPGVVRDGARASPPELVDRFRPDAIVGNERVPGYVVVRSVPRILALREELYRERMDDLARDWLEPEDAPAGPPALAHPFRLRFAPGEAHGFRSDAAPRAPPEPIDAGRGAVLATTSDWTGFPAGALASPPFRIDFDELVFDLAGVGTGHLFAELVVDGTAVLSHAARTADGAFETVRFPLSAWRGRTAYLRCEDRAVQGWLALDDVRSVRWTSVESFDDFEGEAWSTRWTATFASDGPASWRVLAERFGPRFVLGRRTALSIGTEGPQALVSAPFRVEHDGLAAAVLDLGDAIRVELVVGDERVPLFTGTRTGRVMPLVADLRPWRGREAVLAVLDGEPSSERAIGIDAIVLFDRQGEP